MMNTNQPKTYGAAEGRHHGRLFIRSGEFRAPRKGEFYLSGAIPLAWEAPNDLGTAYHILREVKRGPAPLIPA